jgi:hypothetical protein
MHYWPKIDSRRSARAWSTAEQRPARRRQRGRCADRCQTPMEIAHGLARPGPAAAGPQRAVPFDGNAPRPIALHCHGRDRTGRHAVHHIHVRDGRGGGERRRRRDGELEQRRIRYRRRTGQ